jgi:secondary thiamine-phosphate synthase enzyme
MVYQQTITLESKAFDSMYEITSEIASVAKKSGITNGIVHIFVIGSTASLTTIEWEPGLQEDMPRFLNKLLPRGASYQHDLTWHDGNGDGHLKSSLLGPDLTIPLHNGNLILGTWQQVILIDSDNKRRSRNIFITVLGE